MNSSTVRAAKMATMALGALVVVGTATIAYDTSKPAPRISRTLRATARAHPRSDGWVMSTSVYQLLPDRFTRDGTIRAMTQRLDYLNELGVETIWLMPVYRVLSAPAYDVVDYTSIDPRYGTDEELLNFVRSAHRAKMHVILELPLNHTSSQHRWFVGSDRERRDDWYVWGESDRGRFELPLGADTAPGKTWFRDPLAELDRNHNGNAHDDDYFYCALCDVKNGSSMGTLSDLNWMTALQQLEDGQPSALFDEVEAIMRHWVVYLGFDGFRASGTRYLVEVGGSTVNRDRPETHRVWQELRQRLSRMAPQAVLIADADCDKPEDSLAYLGQPGHPEFHGTMHFGYSNVLTESVENGWRQARFFAELYGVQSHLPYDEAERRLLAQDFLFLSNHERSRGNRIASRFGGNSAQTKLAASVYLLSSGNPVVYYGEEYGMRNVLGESGDGAVRGRMDWDEVERQRQNPASTYRHYARLLRLRRHFDALRMGRSLVVPSKSPNDAGFDGPWVESPRIVVMREYFEERILVLSNLLDIAQHIVLDLGARGLPALPDGTPAFVLMGNGVNEPVTAANRRAYSAGTLGPNETRVIYLGVLPGSYKALVAEEGLQAR